MREEAGIRLGDFARALGVSAPYLSDVELGNRQPFDSDRLERIAVLLSVKPTLLKVLAAETRGAFNLEPMSEDHQRAGRALMRRWHKLDADKLDMIVRIVGDDDDEKVEGDE
jgi:transcriptional regulator with XRE-family HTH domain